jgi:predicted RNA-binding Zn-ribbon protein involved in translation (DUF1610 family)
MGGQPAIKPFDPHRLLVGKDPWGFLFDGARACTSCGTTIRAGEHAERDVAGERVHARAGERVGACPACGNRDWAEAVRDGGRG